MTTESIPHLREHWTSRTAFVFAAIGSAIGLGNVWRFPRICAENGGFAFLIAFVVGLITTGIPLLVLELAMGERTQKSAPGAFRAAGRKLEFFGWVVVGIGFVITCYYAVVMSWCWSYVGFSVTLAWGDAPRDFFFNSFLNLSDPAMLPGGWGDFSTPILIGSALSWIAIIACIWKGVQSVSKVVYLTVLLPWLLLLVFVVRGVTLEGAGEGLSYYLLPKGDWWRFLLMPSTWINAYTQVFFSLSIGFGIMFAYGSFLDRETDIVKNALLIGISDSLTAFVAGLAVFSCLGHLSTPEAGGIPISDWMNSSLGIAFIAYPKLISLIAGGTILGPLFFLMLLLLAIDSAFSLVEASVASLEDKFGWSHHKSMSAVCVLGFLLGLPFMFQSGLFWFDTVDRFMNHQGLVWACLLECIVFGHLYGARRIRNELLEHRENHIGPSWEIMVRYVSPVVLICLLGWELWERYQGSYEGYGRRVEFLGGWLVLIVIVLVALILTVMKGTPDSESDFESKQ